MSRARPYHPHGTGTRLAVRITPKASRSEVSGVVADLEGRPALAVRIAAPPVDGAANAALIAFVAKALGVRKSAVRIVSGETGRLKLIEIESDAETIGRRLDGILGGNGAG